MHLGLQAFEGENKSSVKFCKKMINWEKSDMVLNFYPSQVFFSKHIFHLDIIKGSKETDEVKRKGLFLVPAAPAQFLYTFFSNIILKTKMT